uniref:Uncharacterized protein n=1 Tax=Anguilla anguilla TaxID=7936 RepID=A0A0E9QQ49_ANGAN
MAAGEQIWW